MKSLCTVLVTVFLAGLLAEVCGQSYSFTQSQQIKSSNPGVNNFFGWSMFLDKTSQYIAVGAPLASYSGSNNFYGIVNVYQRNGAASPIPNATINWQASGTSNLLQCGERQQYDFMGQAVFVGVTATGNVLVAAYAPRASAARNREGSVYLFSRQHSSTPSANAWFNNSLAAQTVTTPNGRLGPFTAGSPYRFGEALAGDLNRNGGKNPILVIGEFRYLQKTGRVHIYYLNAGGQWQFNNTISPPNSQIFNSPNSGFGISLSMYDDVLAIGSSGAQLNRGAVHVYRDTSVTAFSQFTLLSSLRALDGVVGDQYGWSVSITPTWLAIGANRRQDCGIACGAVYVNAKDTGSTPTTNQTDGWGQLVKVAPKLTKAGAQIGYSVDMDGDFLVVGAPSASFDNATDQTGGVLVFQRNTGTDGYYKDNAWGQVGYFSKSPLGVRDRLGRVVQSFAPHVLATSMLEDTTAANSGALYYYYSSLPYGGLTGNPAANNNTNGTSTTAGSTTGAFATSTFISAGPAATLETFFF